MVDRPRVLILGGTAEAVALAERLSGRLAVTYSLAGRTASPNLPVGVDVRTGGFGGANALSGWMADNAIAALIDATHPFAARIATNAAAATTARGCPRLKLLRPPWAAKPGDDWRNVADIHEAARLTAEIGSSVFLSVGHQELGAFGEMNETRFLVRTVDAQPELPLGNAVAITGRGPFSVTDETALLRDHAIDVIVSKNAGGAATYAKIEAARDLKLPVVMIRRPTMPMGEIASDVDGAVSWLEGRGL